MASEYLQGWRLHDLPEQPVLVLNVQRPGRDCFAGWVLLLHMI